MASVYCFTVGLVFLEEGVFSGTGGTSSTISRRTLDGLGARSAFLDSATAAAATAAEAACFAKLANDCGLDTEALRSKVARTLFTLLTGTFGGDR